jgi:pimeloyl-ACP methyl ester carboxylesterase
MTYVTRMLIDDQLMSAGSTGTGLAMSHGAHAAKPETKPTFVFVHGAWHGEWCWAKVIRLLTEQGYDGVTLDLPGHGLGARFPASYKANPQNTAGLSTEVSPLAATTLDNYRDHVLTTINSLVGSGSGPVILVGHSLGGATLNAVAEMQPTLIRRLVYLTAFVPVAKPSVLDYLTQSNFVRSRLTPLFLGDPTALGATRINPNSSDPTYVANIKEALYQDVEDSVFTATLNLLTPDEPIHAFSDPVTVTARHWGSVPRSFIRCTKDHAIPLAGQDQMIAEGDKLTPCNPFMLRTLDTGHSSFLADPEELVRVLLEML